MHTYKQCETSSIEKEKSKRKCLRIRRRNEIHAANSLGTLHSFLPSILVRKMFGHLAVVKGARVDRTIEWLSEELLLTCSAETNAGTFESLLTYLYIYITT